MVSPVPHAFGSPLDFRMGVPRAVADDLQGINVVEDRSINHLSGLCGDAGSNRGLGYLRGDVHLEVDNDVGDSDSAGSARDSHGGGVVGPGPEN